jgi:hypothetical protein
MNPARAREDSGVNWSAATRAGIIGAAVYLPLQMILVPLFVGGSPWGPPRMIAAIVLGRDVLPPPQTFDFGVLITALVVHFLLAILYALILASLVHRLLIISALLTGAVFGLGLYVLNFYLFTNVFEWFVMQRTWVTVFIHLVFGVLTTWSYKVLALPRFHARIA